MKSHGGKRKNAGRKKIKDKKVTVIFYIRKSALEIFGGKSAFIEYVNSQIGD
jgi:hypothetical protein